MKKTIILQLLLLLAIPFSLIAQDTRVIKGKILNASDGKPLPGASIYLEQAIGAQTNIKGVISNYSIGTTSDVNGNFSLTVPSGTATLVVTFIGYEQQKVDVNGINHIDIKLAEQNKTMDEVVVTGYQNVKQRKLTSSISKIESKEIIQASVPSIDQMLQGKVAGVQTMVTSGAPGAPAKIRIRGTASLSGTQDPLWVLDGIPLEGTSLPDLSGKNIDQLVNTSIGGLNPNDILDITILKDAAATAIYGTRAANGVIVITTKKGNKGRLEVNFNSNLSINLRPEMSRLHLLNSNQKVDLELDLAKRSDLTYRNNMGGVARILNQYGEYDSYQTGGYDALSTDAKAAITKLRNSSTDWGKEIYQTAVNQNHSLSISGGNDKSNYYFSVGYYDEKGTTKGTSLNRLNMTFKSEHQLLSNLKFSASIFTNRKDQESYLTADSYNNPNRYSRTANPYQLLKDANGYVYDKDIAGYDKDVALNYNFLEEKDGTSRILKGQSINTNFTLKWNPIKDITYTSQLGLQYDETKIEESALQETYYTRNQRERSKYWDKTTKKYVYALPQGGIIRNFDTDNDQWTWKNMAEWNKVLYEKHEIDFMIGSELRRNGSISVNSAGYGYDDKTLTNLPFIFPNEDMAKSFLLYTKSKQRNAFASFFSTASYTYDRRYTLFGSVRYDGSDLFGVDPKYKYLPLWSVGAAWNVINEPWMKDIKWVTTLKVRGSYGLQGNIDKNTSPYIVATYGNATILPGNSEKVLGVDSPPNSKLRWEKTATYDGGIDVGVLNNRVLFSIDGYFRRSSDLVGLKSIPLENGFSTTTLNWAEVTNKGIEFNITTRNIDTKDFSWTTNFNIAKNINKVNQIEVGQNQVTPSLVGHPVNALFGIKTAGLDSDGYPLFWKEGKKVSVKEFFKLNSLWGIPDLVATDLTQQEIRDSYSYMGSADPKMTGGLINTFRYKEFTLNVSMNIILKQTVKINPFYSMTSFDRSNNTTTNYYDIWSPTNTNGKYPAIVSSDSYNGSRAEEYFFMNAVGQPINAFNDLDIWYKTISYVRVGNIRLSYDFPTKLLQKSGIKSLRFSAEALNPFVFGSNYSGYFDPETYGSIYAQPISRAFTFGVNLIF